MDILGSLLQSAENPLDGLLRAFVTYNITGLVWYIWLEGVGQPCMEPAMESEPSPDRMIHTLAGSFFEYSYPKLSNTMLYTQTIQILDL
jgi:hypothetical protein